MTSETDAFEAARELFDALCDLPPAEREPRLADACGRDSALRRRVESLLERDSEPHAGLDRSPAAGLVPGASVEKAPQLPARIGPYEIVRVLGVGGMGVVYEALQPALGRRVALKLARSALLGENQRRRAQQEASLLGRLRHPGIATIYEVGEAQLDGVPHPYLAMELVTGRPLDAYAREHGLAVRARLALVARVARAVHHAHAHGVLHRDLKPSNILVDEGGEPRVLDFGVARLLERDGTTTVTATGTVVGTLGYMSPEQVSGAASELDARSDVYALGVILYQLLSGRLPHEVADLPLPEAARRICEHAPAPLDALALDGLLPQGDLETIVTTALARERERRYRSAEALAEDLERCLRHEPIAARPASTFYHLRLFARRNPALVASSSLAVAAVLAGALSAGWMALRQADLRRLAEQRGRESERLAYRSNVIAAALALEDDNPNQARRLLADVHVPQPAWELARLQRQLEEWTARIEHGLGRVWQAGFTRRGQELVAISSQGALGCWDVESGVRTLALAADPLRACPVALSPDGEQALSVRGNQARLWSTRDGATLREWTLAFELLEDARGTAAVSGTGQRAALTTADGRLLVLDLASGAQLGPFGRGRPTLDARGELLVEVEAGRVRVRELASGRLRDTFAGPPGVPRAVALHPSGERLVIATAERSLHVLALADGALHALTPDTPDVATMLAFEPAGRFLAAMLEDSSLWLWDVAEGRLRHRFRVGRGAWKTSLAWSPDGERLLSAAHSSSVLHLWDARAEPEVLRGHTSYVYPTAYALAGERIVSGGWDDTLRLWDARTGRLLETLRPHGQRVQTLAVSPDGTRIASGSPDGSLVLLEASGGVPLARLVRGSNWSCLAWSPAGLLAAGTTGKGAGVHVFAGDGLVPRAALERTGNVQALAFHPREPCLAVAAGNRLLLLQPDGLATLATLEGGPVNTLAFSPDGQVLAAGDDWGRIVLRDAATLAERLTLAGHRQEVFGLAFTPDGERLFSGGRDRLLRVWSPATGDLLGELAGHDDYLWSVAVSPDGKRVLTGSGDHTLRQWESEPVSVTFERRRAAERGEAALTPR